MTDNQNNLYLYEAIELRAEYQGRIETLKKLLPESRGLDRLFRARDDGHSRPAAEFSVDEVRDELKALEFKARKLNNAIQRANFENQVSVRGESMNLVEALELRKAVNERISELSAQLASSAYVQVIYKEDRDIVEDSGLEYPRVRGALEEKRILFRELNRGLRAASFQILVDFKDE